MNLFMENKFKIRLC